MTDRVVGVISNMKATMLLQYGAKQSRYALTTPEKLIADIQRDIARWNRENSDA